MRIRVYIILIISVLAASCGEYEKLLKSSDFELKKTRAREYFEAGQYSKATELLSQILPRFRATEEAEELNWLNARSFYEMRDYYMAGSYFKSFVEQFPFGKYAEEAAFMAAKCDHHISPRAELDQASSRSAIEGFTIFINRYPNNPRVEESRALIREMEDRLVEKSYLSARLYYDMTEYRAAIVALNNSLKEYTESKYREEMMFLKLNSLYRFAENSQPNRQKERFQDTLDDYFSFMEEFPESRYSREVGRVYQATTKFLKTGSIDSEFENIE